MTQGLVWPRQGLAGCDPPSPRIGRRSARRLCRARLSGMGPRPRLATPHQPSSTAPALQLAPGDLPGCSASGALASGRAPPLDTTPAPLPGVIIPDRSGSLILGLGHLTGTPSLSRTQTAPPWRRTAPMSSRTARWPARVSRPAVRRGRRPRLPRGAARRLPLEPDHAKATGPAGKRLPWFPATSPTAP